MDININAVYHNDIFDASILSVPIHKDKIKINKCQYYNTSNPPRIIIQYFIEILRSML